METKRGRPEKRPMCKRTKTVILKLTPIEYGRLKKAACDENRTVSGFIREHLKDFLYI